MGSCRAPLNPLNPPAGPGPRPGLISRPKSTPPTPQVRPPRPGPVPVRTRRSKSRPDQNPDDRAKRLDHTRSGTADGHVALPRRSGKPYPRRPGIGRPLSGVESDTNLHDSTNGTGRSADTLRGCPAQSLRRSAVRTRSSAALRRRPPSRRRMPWGGDPPDQPGVRPGVSGCRLVHVFPQRHDQPPAEFVHHRPVPADQPPQLGRRPSQDRRVVKGGAGVRLLHLPPPRPAPPPPRPAARAASPSGRRRPSCTAPRATRARR